MRHIIRPVHLNGFYPWIEMIPPFAHHKYRKFELVMGPEGMNE